MNEVGNTWNCGTRGRKRGLEIRKIQRSRGSQVKITSDNDERELQNSADQAVQAS